MLGYGSRELIIISLCLIIFATFCEGAIVAGDCGGNCHWKLDDATGELTIYGTGSIDAYQGPSMAFDWGCWCMVPSPGVPLWNNYGSKIKTAVIMEGITSIGEADFCKCTEMTSITIGNTVDTIGDNAFKGCTKLEKMIIPNSVISFWDNNKEWNLSGPLHGCDNLQFNEYDNGLYLGNPDNLYHTFVRPKDKSIKTFTVHDGTQIILGKAFKDCVNLETVSIPDSVTSLGYHVFENCPKMNFSYNTADNDYVLQYIGNERNPYHALVTAQENDTIVSLKVHDDTVVLANYAFMNCYRLETMIFGKRNYYIGGHLMTGWNKEFTDKDGNKYGNVKKNVTLSSNRAVQIYKTHFPAENIYRLTLDGVTDVKDNAFSHEFSFCKSLEKVTLANTVASIGINAFDGCSLLAFNHFRGALYLGNDENPFLALIKAQDTSITSCIINSRTKIIAGGAFAGCSQLEHLEIPDSVTYVGSNVFDGCTAMQHVDLGSNVTTIEDGAFSGCDKLEELDLPDSVVSIGSNSFSNCAGLKTVAVGKNVSSVGKGAFAHCPNLETVTIQANTINGAAFFGCDSLKTVVIGDGVKSIGSGAFKSCNNLESVVIADSVTSISDEAFEFCTNLKSVTIGNQVTSIGRNAFEYCTNLKSVTIPKSVASIDTGAFGHCTSLTEVSYSGTTDPGKNSKAFIGCKELQKIEVPDDYADQSFCGRKTGTSTSSALLNSKPTNWFIFIVSFVVFILLFP